MTKCRDHFRYLTLLLVGFAFVAWGVGCQPPQKESGPPEKVTIAYSVATDGAVAIVAHVQGYFREEALETTPRLHPFGKPALQDVLEGRADFATVAETPVMFAIMKGEKVSIIATIQATNQENAIIARRDRGISGLGDLRGRKIATTLGTTLDYYLDAVLAAQGISRKEVTIIDLSAEKMPDALESGEVDAISTFHPYIIPAQKKLGARAITLQDKDIYTATFNIAAKQEFIHQNPDRVKKLLRALIKAEKFVKEHPAEAQKIVSDFSGVDISIVREIWDSYNFAVKLDQSLLLALEDESRWAIKYKLVDVGKAPNFLDFVYLEGLRSVKPEAIRILK